MSLTQKAPFKMRRFENVQSKVTENLRNFKSYVPPIEEQKLDELINKVQQELNELEQHN